MARNRWIYRIVAAIVVCVAVLSLSTSTGRERNNYQVETQVYSVPLTQSDATRAINAYERLMDRHMDLTERTFTGITADIKVLTTKFDAMDAKLTALDARLARMDERLERIERHLGIAPAAHPDPNAPKAPQATLADPSATLR